MKRVGRNSVIVIARWNTWNISRTIEKASARARALYKGELRAPRKWFVSRGLTMRFLRGDKIISRAASSSRMTRSIAHRGFPPTGSRRTRQIRRTEVRLAKRVSPLPAHDRSRHRLFTGYANRRAWYFRSLSETVVRELSRDSMYRKKIGRACERKKRKSEIWKLSRFYERARFAYNDFNSVTHFSSRDCDYLRASFFSE